MTEDHPPLVPSTFYRTLCVLSGRAVVFLQRSGFTGPFFRTIGSPSVPFRVSTGQNLSNKAAGVPSRPPTLPPTLCRSRSSGALSPRRERRDGHRKSGPLRGFPRHRSNRRLRSCRWVCGDPSVVGVHLSWDRLRSRVVGTTFVKPRETSDSPKVGSSRRSPDQLLGPSPWVPKTRRPGE